MPKILLVNEPGYGHIIFELVERCEIHSPSQKWQVSVGIGSSNRRGYFQGQIGAWFLDVDLAKFFDQLRDCEKSRRGEARLEALSADDFKLRIFNADSSGHFEVEYEIKYDIGGKTTAQMRDSHSFDPSLLPQLVRDFEQFLPATDEVNESGHTKGN